MPFNVPPVVENFNRVENPLSTNNWLDVRYNAAAGGRRLQANGTQGLIEAASAFCSQMRSTVLNADQSSRLTIAVIPSGATDEVVAFFMRTTDEGTAVVDTYSFSVTKAAGADVWHLDRVNNGAFTPIGSDATQEVSSGDTIGIQTLGSGAAVTIEVYYCPAASDPTLSASYALVTTWTDNNASRLVGSGKVGLELQNNVTRIDNFGEMSIVAATDTTQPVVANKVAVMAGAGGWW